MGGQLGLALAGGGGKGAYHIGVWKALREFDIEPYVRTVAGSSVGALNMALFLQGDLARAEEVWRTISPQDILTLDAGTIGSILAAIGVGGTTIAVVTHWLLGHGIFTHRGLRQLLEQHVDLSRVAQSPIVGFATCSTLGIQLRHFRVNGCTSERIQAVILASSALPVIFPSITIDGMRYIDGGMPDWVEGNCTGNIKNAGKSSLPIQPLYDAGCTDIIAVHLNRDYLIDHDHYPNAHIIEIVPQENLARVVNGMLDFTPEGAQRRMAQGYADAARLLTPLRKMAAAQAGFVRDLQKIACTEQNFSRQRAAPHNQREAMKSELEALLDD